MAASVQSLPPQQTPEYGLPWPGCDVTHCPCVAANLPCQRQAALQVTMQRATAEFSDEDDSPPLDGVRMAITAGGETIHYQAPTDPFAKADRWRFIGWSAFAISALVAGSTLMWLRHGRDHADSALFTNHVGQYPIQAVGKPSRRVRVAEDLAGLMVADQNKRNVPKPHFIGLGETLEQAEAKSKGLIEKLFSNAPLPERLSTIPAELHTVAAAYLTSFPSANASKSRFLPDVGVDVDSNLLRPLVGIILTDSPRAILTRLELAKDGVWLLDWNMLQDAMERRLSSSLAGTSVEPFWCGVIAKRRSGIAEDAWEREDYVILECSTDGSGDDKQIVLIPKADPLGQAMEQKLQFGQAYIGNAHLQLQQLKGRRRLVLLGFRSERLTP